MDPVVVAENRIKAIQLIIQSGAEEIELDYQTAWRDVVELGRLGIERGIRVTARGTENVVASSVGGLINGMSQCKRTYRQRNIYCTFDRQLIGARDLTSLHEKARRSGDVIVFGAIPNSVAFTVWS